MIEDQLTVGVRGLAVMWRRPAVAAGELSAVSTKRCALVEARFPHANAVHDPVAKRQLGHRSFLARYTRS